MRVECDRCGATYKVARDRIADRTLRIRCPRCHTRLVIVGPPLNRPLTRHLRKEARRIRRARRRAVLRSVFRTLATIFILVLVVSGIYMMTTTPGIPIIYTVGFILVNGLVWGASLILTRWTKPPDAPA